MILYGLLLLLGQGVGCAAAIWFLLEHRPRQWRRIEAVDAMGFPIIVAIVFTRGLVLTLLAWPIPLRPMPNMVFSIATLALVDVLLIIKLVNFRRFVRDDSARRGGNDAPSDHEIPQVPGSGSGRPDGAGDSPS